MGFTFHRFDFRVFERIQTRRAPLSENPDRKRRVRAAIACTLAAAMGLLSLGSIQQESIARHQSAHAPEVHDALSFMALAGFREVEAHTLAHSPALDQPGSWWQELPSGRIWLATRDGTALAFIFATAPLQDKPRLKSAPTFEPLGMGWEALPALLKAMRERKRPSPSAPLRTTAPRHPREWSF